MLGSKKGFSLVELLVVIGIIGVLAGIALPRYSEYKLNAKKTALKTQVKAIIKAMEVCLTEKSVSDCDSQEKLNFSELTLNLDHGIYFWGPTFNDAKTKNCSWGVLSSGHMIAFTVPVEGGKPTIKYSKKDSPAGCDETTGTQLIATGTTDESEWAKP